MKRLSLLFAALCMFACPVAASNHAYMGLYTDSAHSYWCTYGVGFYPVEMWIWCLPGDPGVICNEFMISYPVNVIQSTLTQNWSILSVALGNPATGYATCTVSCQSEWFWIAHQLLYVTDPTMTSLSIVAHPAIGAYQIATCEPGYPVGSVTLLTNLYLNYSGSEPVCQGTATEEASWGAIKSLMSVGSE